MITTRKADEELLRKLNKFEDALSDLITETFVSKEEIDYAAKYFDGVGLSHKLMSERKNMKIDE